MSMREILERLVADFDAERVPTGTPRDLPLLDFPGKAAVVVGMRRSGKTWRLFQEIGRLRETGVDASDILYLSFEDERLFALEAEHLHWITDAFRRRRPDRGGVRAHLFLDEIHNVPGWERWIRRLLDQENVRIVLTGSSAKLLSREIATSLRGRSLTAELLPFSLAEAVRHRGQEVPTTWPPPAAERDRLASHLRRYLHEGGFPEVQEQPRILRHQILQDYVDVVLLRDVAERHGVENLEALRYLQRALLSRPSNRFSIHKLYNDLRSQGVRVSKDTLHEHLGHLEDAFLVFTTEIFARSLRVRRSNPRKVYPVDPGLAASSSFAASGDEGHLLETTVYLELRRRGFESSWYRTAAGNEVDLLARDVEGNRALVQVAAELSRPETRRRELRALEEAMGETGLDRGTVVTLDDEETVQTAVGVVRIVPAWRWLLEDRGEVQ